MSVQMPEPVLIDLWFFITWYENWYLYWQVQHTKMTEVCSFNSILGLSGKLMLVKTYQLWMMMAPLGWKGNYSGKVYLHSLKLLFVWRFCMVLSTKLNKYFLPWLQLCPLKQVLLNKQNVDPWRCCQDCHCDYFGSILDWSFSGWREAYQ